MEPVDMSDIRRLIVHCGQTKAGSSAIQAFFRDSPPLGLVYPATGQWADGAHHMLAFALRGQTRRGDKKVPAWTALEAALVDELDAAKDTALISCELLDPELLDELLDKVLPKLRRPFDHVEIVLCMRHPLERAASTYNQRVKDAVISESRMPDEYLAQSGRSFCLAPVVSRWDRIPYKVTYLNYHPAETLLPRFLDTLGFVETATASAIPRRNRSTSGLALVALLAADRLGLSSIERKSLFEKLRADREYNMWKGPSFPFSVRAAQHFLNEVVAEDTRQLQGRSGLDLSNICQTTPDRFRIDAAQRMSLAKKFATFELSAEQLVELERVLSHFQGQDAPPQTANLV